MASVAVIEKSIISSERLREVTKFQSGTFSAKKTVMASSASPRAESRSERREVIISTVEFPAAAQFRFAVARRVQDAEHDDQLA